MDTIPDTPETSPAGSRLEEHVAEIDRLLAKHRLLETVARRQQTERSALLEEMQRRQNLVELQKRLRALHPADVANILDSEPLDDRMLVWGELPARLAGAALVEVGPGVRESLIEHTSRERLVNILRELDADDVRYLSASAAGRGPGRADRAARRARPIVARAEPRLCPGGRRPVDDAGHPAPARHADRAGGGR